MASGIFFGPWLGGVQDTKASGPASDWFWVTGEPFTFTNWHLGEPNDLFGNLEEDRIVFFASEGVSGNRSNLWNDEWSMRRINNYYVIEYVPEPATYAIALASLFQVIGRPRSGNLTSLLLRSQRSG
ncbi:hypothetical protein Pr1d_07740 [Bythopirellula goksoeyrii]|uniref:C-type lectin domain-containing protein n=1 Tax=Bythopirellula goksoeyrii TaxID=1400387 RepID=A0A5B9Q722_9BACT|nr:hypothetical protein Pr1d_07740 [Bythopirellula goksoeyrii]